MQLLSLVQLSQTVSTGQMSDGSDRVTTTHQYWEAVVFDDLGLQQTIDFPFGGAQPTHQQIIDRISKPAPLVPSSKADLETYMDLLYAAWWRWHNTRIEAQARTLSAGVVTALTNKENASWTTYAQSIQNWVQAS